MKMNLILWFSALLCVGNILGTNAAASVDPDSLACNTDDAHACLKIMLKMSTKDRPKYMQAALAIAKSHPTEINLASSATAAIAASASTKEYQNVLAVICEKNKLPEACLVYITRTDPKDPTSTSARNKAKETLAAQCAAKVGTACATKALIEFETSPDQATADYKTACELGDMDSCITLGDDCAAKDKHVDARAFYMKACDLHEPLACAKIAREWKEEGDSKKASEFAAARCGAGDSDSCRYSYDQAVTEKDKVGIEKYSRLGCVYSDTEACIEHGIALASEKRSGEARMEFERFCNSANPEPRACFELGWLLAKVGDYKAAKIASTKACDAGNGKGCAALLNSSVLGHAPTKKETTEIMKKSIKLFKAQCSQGSNEACGLLEKTTSIYESTFGKL